jgi:dTDP-4-amino-4,6-dideoxygalactose transaminase
MHYDPAHQTNYQYVVVEVDAAKSGLSRDELVAILESENVLARRYFFPGCHRMEPYRSFFPNAGLLLPETERLCANVMVLPTGTAVEGRTVETICGIISTATSHSSQVREHLTLRTKPQTADVARPATGIN